MPKNSERLTTEENALMIALLEFYKNELAVTENGSGFKEIISRASTCFARSKHLVAEHVGAWPEKLIREEITEIYCMRFCDEMRAIVLRVALEGKSPIEHLEKLIAAAKEAANEDAQ